MPPGVWPVSVSFLYGRVRPHTDQLRVRLPAFGFPVNVLQQPSIGLMHRFELGYADRVTDRQTDHSVFDVHAYRRGITRGR